MTNPSKKSSSILKDFKNLIIWVILALIIRWQVIEPRWIPSGSMLPTLQIQDKILVEKITPKINLKDNLDKLRDSIVVFNPPETLIKAGYDSDIALIKRVIGVPGDKVEIKEGILYLNNKAQNKYITDKNINYSMSPIKIPANSLWVMGDNRNNSMDSHIWGPLPSEKIIGRAILRYWPLNQFGPIYFPETS
tara:strand:+ start:1299 stop:1874 length:576 start_codon:yes stop_codon:yes gene_type:complete